MIRTIAEAGSTKIDWVVDIGGQKKSFTSKGWNPSQDKKDLTIEDPDLINALKKTDQLYYYGSGIESLDAQEKGKKVLSTFLSSNAVLEIETDITASARALFGNEEGIACILGTGSNALFYDGYTCNQKIPSLGYLMSDEASGFDIGRAVVQSYFYKTMPTEIRDKFKSKYKLDKASLLQKLYQEDQPNVFLSSFCPFLQEVEGQWKDYLLINQFTSFIEARILCYKNFLSVPIGFVGSIAYHFSDQLEEACEDYDIDNIIIIEKPIDALIEFHLL